MRLSFAPPRFALLLAALALTPLPLAAEGVASGAALRAAVVGNTIEGSMAASGAYAEFYAEDGTIRAPDYQGSWSIQGDQMCFDYGDGPAGCWQAVISGASVTWMGPGGEEGSGRILPGNPGGW